jgi:hypothetical protein
MKIRILKEFKKPERMDFKVTGPLATPQEMAHAAQMYYALQGDAVVFEQFTEDFDIIVSDPASPNEEYVMAFYNGLKSNKASEYLSDLSPENLSGNFLLMTGEMDGGMACSLKGHMGSGWNNSPRKGILKKIMDHARDNYGGRTGDHFEGGLGNYYKSLGLTEVYKVSFWNDKYAPNNWPYKLVDIFNPRRSAYAKAFEQFQPDSVPDETMELTIESGLNVTMNPYEKMIQYRYGMPDVIYRRYS